MLNHLSLLHPIELFIIFVFSTYNFSISNKKTNYVHIQFETLQMILCKISKHSKVLIFCVEYRELSHLTCDLSQAEKKITVFTS